VKLRDWFPIRDYNGTSIIETDAAYKHLDVEVIEQVSCYPDEGPQRDWPGKHMNVHCYVRLANGRIVGLNENPGRGWSFPVMKDPQA
jgi:hypothetical protein